MGPHPYITCLDLATQTGVAHGRAGTAKPSLETWSLSPAKTRPERLVLLDTMLDRHIADYRPDIIYYEQALPIAVLIQIGASDDTIQMLRSLIAVTEQACARNGVEVRSWAVQAARKSVMGQGRFKRGEAKRQVAAFCRMLGYSAQNEHECDALIGFLWASAMLNPRWASVQGPLFRTAV